MGGQWRQAGRRVARAAVAALTVTATALLPGLGAGPAAEEAAAAPLVQIDAGGAFTCALRSGRDVVCWGDNAFGQATPPAGLVATQVSAGAEHTCALVGSKGAVVCWGNPADGRTTPPAGLQAVQVSAGGGHTCALSAIRQGQVICWGANAGGQATPPAGLRASQVSAGGSQSCALRAGDIVCWGFSVQPPGLPRASLVSAGGHTCALRAGDGLVGCWSYIPWIPSITPPTGLKAGQVSVGDGHACASRAADGVTVCWGDNAKGQAPQPYLVALPTQFGFVGEAFGVYLGDLVGSPLPGSATYAVTGGWLPLGLTLDPGVGVITGTPLVAGDYSFTVTATDGVNFQASRTYRMLIIQIIPA
jgi:hypothetical protein